MATVPLKKATTGFEGTEQPVHKIRITLTSRKVKELEKGQFDCRKTRFTHCGICQTQNYLREPLNNSYLTTNTSVYA